MRLYTTHAPNSANSTESRMARSKIAAPLIRTESQTARPLIQLQFRFQGVKRKPRYQIVECVASVKQNVLPEQRFRYDKSRPLLKSLEGAARRGEKGMKIDREERKKTKITSILSSRSSFFEILFRRSENRLCSYEMYIAVL